MDSIENIKVEKLNEPKQWSLWKFQMRIVLKSINAYEIVTGILERPIASSGNSNSIKAWDELDIKAQRAFIQSIGSKTSLHLIKCKTSSEMWKKLHEVFEQKSHTGIHFLQQKFYNAKIESDQDISTFIVNLEETVQELTDLGEKVSDSMIITKILMSLPENFAYFHSAWDSTEDDKKTLDNLRTRLMIEEKRIQIHSGNEGGAFYSKNVSKGNKKKEKTPGMCNICKKGTHWRRDCPQKSTNSKKKGDDALCCESVSKALIACGDKSAWYLDSGATEHMSPKRSLFKNYKRIEKEHPIRIGNGHVIYAVGKGNIDVSVFDGKKWNDKFLENVLHVPDLYANLFSQGKVLDKGFIMKSDKERCEFSKNGHVVTFGIREHSLYKMLIQSKVGDEIEHANIAVNATKCDSLKMWHERFAHQNIAQVKSFLKRNGINFIDQKDFVCEACVFGKAHRLSFAERKEKANACGEVISADVCGPFEKDSLGGSKYFLLLKDEYSHFRYVFFIKQKSEVTNKVEYCLKQIQKEIGHGIKMFRSDNGTEFINKQMQKFLESEGIKHQRTVAYTPEQNACAEREMRTIVEAARTLLHSNKLPAFLWAEAINSSVYVLNRTGTSSVENKSPYEIWFNKSVNVNNLKVFGSVVYSHIPKEKRKKLDKKAIKCIFVGYDECVKGFRVYNPENRTINTVRDVFFNEKEVVNSFNGEKVDNFKMKQVNDHNDIDETVIRLNLDDDSGTCGFSSNDPENADDVNNSSIYDNDFSNSTMVEAPNSDNSLNETTIINNLPSGSLICDVTERNVINKRLRSGASNVANKNVNEGHSSANFCMADFIDSAFLAMSEEPKTYREAINSNEKKEWIAAMNDEFDSLMKNGTWILVSSPINQHIIDNRWVFKKKENPDGSLDRFKARLVVRGFDQVFGIDYNETFSPVVKHTSIRTIFALAAIRNMKMKQFDVKTAFLYGDLKEDVYMKQPIGYDDGSGRVCKLVKSLYGLKQASRCWNDKFTHFIKKFEFEESDADSCVFVRKKNDDMIILAIYVDDGLITTTNEKFFDPVIEYLKKHFEIKVFEAKCFLGFEIDRLQNGSIHLNQKGYINRILNKFNLIDANPVSTPMDCQPVMQAIDKNEIDFPYKSAIGSLIYLAIGTRPDISFAVGFLGRFGENPSKLHVTAVKRVMRYLKGTSNFGILFSNKTSNNLDLHIYSDADFAGDTTSRKSTTGFCVMIGTSIISWCSERQKSVSLSTTESEYIAASQSIKEFIWIHRLLSSMDGTFLKPVLHMDNQSALKLIKNPEFHKRSKHIDVRYHFIREKFSENLFDLKYVQSSMQLADIFTKPLAKPRFEFLRKNLKIVPCNDN